MLRITVEIFPKGDESKRSVICIADIWNTGLTSLKTDGVYGDYEARFMQSVSYNPKKVWKKGFAKKIHRKNRGVWDILYLCLKNAGLDKRNGI